jgi:hypothetical protein
MANSIIIIVEGPGEIDAVPILLRRLLLERQNYDVTIQSPINAHGLGNLTTEKGLEKFLTLALKRPSCSGILIMVDADVDCAKQIAEELAGRARNHNPHVATVIVAAKYRYENWFLASTETLGGKRGLAADLPIVTEPERIPDAKRWITNHKSQGRTYKETLDQAPLSQLIDIKLVSQRSRSFRRLVHAVDELLDSISTGTPLITPTKSCSIAD